MKRTRECREYRNFLGRRLRGLNAMFFPLPVTYFLVTYVLLLATQGTIGGVMQGSGAIWSRLPRPLLRHLASRRTARGDGDAHDLRGRRWAGGPRRDCPSESTSGAPEPA
jgi:hypothetical protein